MNTTVQHPERLLAPGAAQIAIALITRALRTPRYIADVFVNWSPHCDMLDVTIYPAGWVRDETRENVRDQLYINLGDEMKHIEDAYSRISARLDQLEAEASENPERETLIAETKAAELRSQAAKLLAKADAISPLPVHGANHCTAPADAGEATSL